MSEVGKQERFFNRTKTHLQKLKKEMEKLAQILEIPE